MKTGSVLTKFPTNCMFLGTPNFFITTILSSFMKLEKKEKSFQAQFSVSILSILLPKKPTQLLQLMFLEKRHHGRHQK